MTDHPEDEVHILTLAEGWAREAAQFLTGPIVREVELLGGPSVRQREEALKQAVARRLKAAGTDQKMLSAIVRELNREAVAIATLIAHGGSRDEQP